MGASSSQPTIDGAAMVRPPMSALQQALLSFFWFATNAQWTAILLVTMPSQVKAAVGNDIKGSALGLALGFGAFVSMLAAPVFGALSDRIRLPGGRRKPWVVIGTLGNVVSLLGLAYLIQPGHPESVAGWTVAFLFVELFNNVATAPYSALIPDLVPVEQRGAASGWMGLMTMLGTLVGGLLGLMIDSLGGISGVYFLLMAVLLLGMVVTVFGIKEPDLPVSKPMKWQGFWRELLSPFKDRDFTWVFLTRMLVTMGIFTVQEFLQYYMGDVIGAPFVLPGLGKVADTPEAAVSLFVLPLIVGAIASTLTAGVLSDRRGRKIVVYLAGALMGLVALVFVIFHSFTLVVLMAVIFGLGYGAYESVDWALASDVLPSMDDYAKDMGVWHVAFVLPQVIATPIGGFLLDKFQVISRTQAIPNLGYTVIFLVAVLYFILGTVFVRQIKSVR
ncbi:MAG TPA: MFS transporter [Aggregatilineaceae bacterium]|nr:MFS transporter [Aggregatilineaceae bacterium]